MDTSKSLEFDQPTNNAVTHAVIAALFPVIAFFVSPADARGLTPSDIVSLARLGQPTASPDGRWLVWDQQEMDVAANKGERHLWRLELDRPDAVPEKFASAKGAVEEAPAFAADGSLYFLSDSPDGTKAVYRDAMDGAAATRVTGSYDLSGFKVSPTGTAILVWADRPVGAQTLDEAAPLSVSIRGSARMYQQLPVRHWNRWADGTRSQIFLIPVTDFHAPSGGRAIASELIGDAPSKPKGGAEEVAWSADGRTIFFALREAGRIEPLSENFDIYKTVVDGTMQTVNLTKNNNAIDTDPATSPDGRWLAWSATSRPDYQSDRHTVWLRDLSTGETHALTGRWDRSVDELQWAADSKSLYVTAAETLDHPVFSVQISDGAITRLTAAGHVSNVVPLRSGAIVFELDSLTAPPDLWRRTIDGRLTRLTAINANRLTGMTWPAISRFTFPGARGENVSGIALRPAGLAPGAKAPVAFMVHGGPQSTFSDAWSFNWNLAAWTSHGYGVVTIDFHGSIGYGQAFTGSVIRDWGGKPLIDLKRGLAVALERFDYLDGTRICAAGGSYGGYMMNWIEGSWSDRFRCLVQHDGIFDQRAMAYETDELAADRWDFGNQPYYRTPVEYEKWNPVKKVLSWKTPQLVITGEQDFRSPYTEAIAAFTALQDRGVPSKLLVFPDEGHVVTKPQNSLQWYDEVFGWMDRWTGTNAQPEKQGTTAAP